METGKPMKGQFFLLGAVLMITIFFIGSVSTREVFVSLPDADLPYITTNLMAEYPKALNLGSNSSGGVEAVINFSGFVNSSLSERYIKFHSLWVVTQNSSTDLNVTVGNWLGSSQEVSLGIGATSSTLSIPPSGINYTTFSAPGTNFTLTINFSENNGSLYTWRDKTSMYLYINLSRGDNMAIDDAGF